MAGQEDFPARSTMLFDSESGLVSLDSGIGCKEYRR